MALLDHGTSACRTENKSRQVEMERRPSSLVVSIDVHLSRAGPSSPLLSPYLHSRQRWPSGGLWAMGHLSPATLVRIRQPWEGIPPGG